LYTFFSNNKILIISFTLFTILNFIAYFHVREIDSNNEKLESLKIIQKKFQLTIGELLMKDCERIFANNFKLLEPLVNSLDKKSVKVSIFENKIFTIEDLDFLELVIISNFEKDSNLVMKDKGYFVRNSKSKKCFGII